MNDYYDLLTMSRRFPFDAEVLVEAIRATFERRGTPVLEQLLSRVEGAERNRAVGDGGTKVMCCRHGKPSRERSRPAGPRCSRERRPGGRHGGVRLLRLLRRVVRRVQMAAKRSHRTGVNESDELCSPVRRLVVSATKLSGFRNRITTCRPFGPEAGRSRSA